MIEVAFFKIDNTPSSLYHFTALQSAFHFDKLYHTIYHSIGGNPAHHGVSTSLHVRQRHQGCQSLERCNTRRAQYDWLLEPHLCLAQGESI